jgi:hypothetical protein
MVRDIEPYCHTWIDLQTHKHTHTYRDPLFYRAVIGEWFATMGFLVFSLLVGGGPNTKPWPPHPTRLPPHTHTQAP